MKTMFVRKMSGALLVWLATWGAVPPVHAQLPPQFVEEQKSQDKVEREVTTVWDSFIQAAAEGDVAKARSFI